MPRKINVSKPAKPATAKPATSVPAIATAKPVQPVSAAPATVTTPKPAKPIVTDATKLARAFVRKTAAGLAKTSANGLSARDNDYLRLLGTTARRVKSDTLRVHDIATDYLAHGAVIFAQHHSKPALDHSVLTGRLLSLGLVSAPAHVDAGADACTITVTGGKTLAAYTTKS